MRTAIVWFRRDLRIADHRALTLALERAERIVPVYVHDPADSAPWPPGAASRWWLHHSLEALATGLAERGAALTLLTEPAELALPRLAVATGARSVHWTESHEPRRRRADAALAAALRAAGVTVDTAPGDGLIEPGSLATRDGRPFRVFTPFARAAQARLDMLAPPLPAPAAIPGLAPAPAGATLAALELRPRIRWDRGFAGRWQPGEAGAQARLAEFLAADLAGYATDRDRLERAATSRLSPHLHFGELSARQILAAAAAVLLAPGTPGRGRGHQVFVRELLWREFAQQLLHHFPHTAEEPLDARFQALRWREDAAGLAAWTGGATGIPLVDAGMRELLESGWMHNRVRMVVASFLTKNLGIHWLEGARWFHDTLVDADLANNSCGWQWSAGCGADAAPYYRIFNPLLQCERFDPTRAYLRRWLPELAALPDEWIHQPFAAPARTLAAAGVALDRSYPRPIVDLRGSRERALDEWARLRRCGIMEAPRG